VLSIMLVAMAMPPRRPRAAAATADLAGERAPPTAGLVGGADGQGAAAAGALAGAHARNAENGAAADACPAPDGARKTR